VFRLELGEGVPAREYERTVATVLNSYVARLLAYLRDLESRLQTPVGVNAVNGVCSAFRATRWHDRLGPAAG